MQPYLVDDEMQIVLLDKAAISEHGLTIIASTRGVVRVAQQHRRTGHVLCMQALQRRLEATQRRLATEVDGTRAVSAWRKDGDAGDVGARVEIGIEAVCTGR